jgi:metal-responsive CopG/Arc/MetJ family transcriptional regulator
MGYAKVAISIEEGLLRKVDRLVKVKKFASRSQFLQSAVRDKFSQLNKTLLARECAKLDPAFEITMAEEGFLEDAKSWPEY